MRFISFNINGVRARLHQLEALRDAHAPAVIGLQETKVADDAFPREAIEALGYHVCYHGQKGHYGVALLSTVAPLDTAMGMPGDAPDEQRRLIRARYPFGDSSIDVINGYFPQGEARDHPVKFPYKERFYARLRSLLQVDYAATEHLLVMGDMNVAPQDRDIGIGADNAKRWLRSGKCSFLPEERAWWTALTECGLQDSYRVLYPEVDDRFSWFDYRSRGFEREPKRGLRIDHILASRALLPRLAGAGIGYDIRAMEKPSDHCPVWADLTPPGGAAPA